MANVLSTLGDEWTSYETRVLQNATTNQRQHMKRAFYMGALSMLSLISKASETMSEDDAAAYVEGLHKEIIALGKLISEGKA